MSDETNKPGFDTDYDELSPELQKLSDLWDSLSVTLRLLDGVVATLETVDPVLTDLEGGSLLYDTLIPARVLKEFIETKRRETDWTLLK